MPTISEADKNLCDREITVGELKESMLSMSDDKSPGNYGISREFYFYFWDDISSLMFDSFIGAKQKMNFQHPRGKL